MGAMGEMFAAFDADPAERPPPFRGRVRKAGVGDAEAIARITAQRDGRQVEELRAREVEGLGAEWNGERGIVLVAEEDGQVVGFGRVHRAERMEEVEEDLRPPAGWYLLGTIVDPPHRRRGIARELTSRRLGWIARRAQEAFYFTRATNRASIELHRALGFEELMRRFRFPRTGLAPGDGVLFRVDLQADR